MVKIILSLVAPLGDVKTTKGKLEIAYKVAKAAYSAFQHFKEHLLSQHPAAPGAVQGGSPE